MLPEDILQDSIYKNSRQFHWMNELVIRGKYVSKLNYFYFLRFQDNNLSSISIASTSKRSNILVVKIACFWAFLKFTTILVFIVGVLCWLRLARACFSSTMTSYRIWWIRSHLFHFTCLFQGSFDGLALSVFYFWDLFKLIFCVWPS